MVYVKEYQPSSTSLRIGDGRSPTRTKLAGSNPLILMLALLGIAYALSEK